MQLYTLGQACIIHSAWYSKVYSCDNKYIGGLFLRFFAQDKEISRNKIVFLSAYKTLST